MKSDQRRKRCILWVAVSFAAFGAHARDVDHRPYGQYADPAWQAPAEKTADFSQLADGRLQLTLSMIAQGCQGELTGYYDSARNHEENHTFVFTPQQHDPETANCRVTVTTVDGAASLRLSAESCSYFHGAACEFDGVYERSRLNERSRLGRTL